MTGKEQWQRGAAAVGETNRGAQLAVQGSGLNPTQHWTATSATAWLRAFESAAAPSAEWG